MPAGTITLTNNSTAVTGSGTAFTSELKASDFLVAVVGGVTYTLGVKSVESATALTLTTAYSGPTTGGLAWTPIPNGTLVGITAQIAADTARAIRGLNFDKQNWQQVYSASGNISVTLPDGSKWTGPSWKYLSDNMATKVGGVVPVSQGGTGAATIAAAQTSLGFGKSGPVIGVNPSSDTSWDNLSANQFFNVKIAGSNSCIGSAQIDGAWTTFVSVRHRNGLPGDGNSYGFVLYDGAMSTTSMNNFTIQKQNGGGAWSSGAVLYHTRNTTKAADGTLKAASPVVKLFSDGRAETNDESEGVTVTRQGVGEYLIEGCMGLNADAAWGGIDGGFDIPKDRNRQPLVWLDYDVNPDGSILVKTYHRTYPDAPAFSRNIRDGYENGDPIDIPADQFVSVRVEMPQNSIWNQKQAAAQKAMEEAERIAAEKAKEEAERAGAGPEHLQPE